MSPKFSLQQETRLGNAEISLARRRLRFEAIWRPLQIKRMKFSISPESKSEWAVCPCLAVRYEREAARGHRLSPIWASRRTGPSISPVQRPPPDRFPAFHLTHRQSRRIAARRFCVAPLPLHPPQSQCSHDLRDPPTCDISSNLVVSHASCAQAHPTPFPR